jgi:hypothetical protein
MHPLTEGTLEPPDQVRVRPHGSVKVQTIFCRKLQQFFRLALLIHVSLRITLRLENAACVEVGPMADILFVDDNPNTLARLVKNLRSEARDDVAAAGMVDIAVVNLRRLDNSGLNALLSQHNNDSQTPVILARGFNSVQDALVAMQRAASDQGHEQVALGELSLERETHAAARWARAVVPIIDSPRDLPKMAAWSHCVAVSVGALRNWCRTAGIGARQSLVFGRLLRVVAITEEEGERPIGDLLDVVDVRTISGLVRLAGLAHGVPSTVNAFLEQQTLVRNEDALNEIRRALERRATFLTGAGQHGTHQVAC